LKDIVIRLVSQNDTIYNFNRVVMRFYEKANVTKVNLIPNDFPHIRFIETFKTDSNQLIYNLGGILGLWFGLSSISIAQLIPFIQQRLKKKYILIKRKILLIIYILKRYDFNEIEY
jgi:hypothetical protein